MPQHTTNRPELRPAPEPHLQNWGLIIGVAVVLLMVVVIVANLVIYEARSALSDTAHPLWAQIARLAGLALTLSVGGWFLWRLLRRRQTPAQTYLNTHLQAATSYIRKIETLLAGRTKGHEQQLLAQIHTWGQTIAAMATLLTELSRNDDIIQADLHHLPGIITDLKEQLNDEANALLQADLAQTLKQRQNQRLALEQLQVTRRQAEIQVERTIAVLGTIYSQLLTYRSTCHVVDYRHLADNVAEEVQQLQDYLEALQEVKGGRPQG